VFNGKIEQSVGAPNHPQKARADTQSAGPCRFLPTLPTQKTPLYIFYITPHRKKAHRHSLFHKYFCIFAFENSAVRATT
jgi:hypothetical protein